MQFLQDTLMIWEYNEQWEEMNALTLHFLLMWVSESLCANQVDIIPDGLVRLHYVICQLTDMSNLDKVRGSFHKLPDLAGTD